MAVSLGGQNLIRLASNLVLTRLLFPEAFGLMALVTVVLSAASMFSDLGIHSSILQDKRGTEPVFLNTAWVLQILRGIVLCLAILLLAMPLAAFYETPLLADLLMVSALVPLIQGFNSTKLATARREIQFERFVALELATQAAGVLTMIALSYWLRSVWALVIGSLVAPILLAVLSHLVIEGHGNRPAFERAALRSLIRFGRFIFFATLASFFVRLGDRAVLGKFVSLDDLAIYNIGFFLASVPLMLSTAIGENVFFALYARRPPAESENNRRKINRARMLLTAGMIGAFGCLALIGDWLIRLLYDPRYEAAGPVLILVALAGIPQIIIQSYEKITAANGHSGRYATFVVMRAILLMLVLITTVPSFGLWSAALAPAVAALLIYPILIWSIRPYQAWDPRHDILFAGIAALVIAGVVWFHFDLLAMNFPGM